MVEVLEPTLAAGPRRRDAVLRREALLNAAIECFETRGYSVSLEEIADHAGVGRGTLYRNFKDRAALTLAIFAREIEKILGKYIQDPIVTVTVAGGVGPYSQQIRVLGQATKPQTLSYREHMSLLDLLIAVGGITDFAAGNHASILRVADGKPQQFGVRLDDLIRDGDVSAIVELRPGDVLIIPERWL